MLKHCFDAVQAEGAARLAVSEETVWAERPFPSVLKHCFGAVQAEGAARLAEHWQEQGHQ